MCGECYSLLVRKKPYRSLEELQTNLDAWLESYNRERPHSGRYCYGKTPWETFQVTRHLALEKDLSRGGDQSDSTVLQHTAVRQFPSVRFGLNFYTTRQKGYGRTPLSRTCLRMPTQDLA